MNLSELIHEFVLALVESCILLGSIGTVSFVNTVNSAFSLGLVFTCISLLYFALNTDFLAAAQLLVYVGAINVLTVFAVMITDGPADSDNHTHGIGYFTALGACAILFLALSYVIYTTEDFNLSLINQSEIFTSNTFTQSNVQKIGYQLLSEFLVPFELVSILLLVALVGAINLARNGDRLTVTKKSSVSSSLEKSSFF
uniref:NAD(P)H-quinone oxidoreductase subunit 6, chloroplastic n=1 Tax=Acrostichum speciosum TaxID=366450 RepID=A0A7M1VGW6_9MONI|nr:NdhG [Acrostichum speciosum]QOS04109.1 NdhG [Acrostichum speciosum]